MLLTVQGCGPSGQSEEGRTQETEAAALIHPQSGTVTAACHPSASLSTYSAQEASQGKAPPPVGGSLYLNHPPVGESLSQPPPSGRVSLPQPPPVGGSLPQPPPSGRVSLPQVTKTPFGVPRGHMTVDRPSFTSHSCLTSHRTKRDFILSFYACIYFQVINYQIHPTVHAVESHKGWWI